jgi:hypothetical protein
VLAVFAESPGSRPLAMRREREELQRLFADRILPRRKVELDLLCHGVTRDRLKQAISARHGYHLVHWSGHGHHNALDLQGEPGNRISGESLVELFTEAGGFIPRVFFLSACHSGALLQVKDWQSLQAALERDERRQGSAAPATASDKAAPAGSPSPFTVGCWRTRRPAPPARPWPWPAPTSPRTGSRPPTTRWTTPRP